MCRPVCCGCSSVAGFHSSRVFKFFKGEDWMKCTLWTALLFPGVVFTVFMGLNTALLFEGSSGAVPLSTLATLIVLWFGVSTPLVFVGSYFGYKVGLSFFFGLVLGYAAFYSFSRTLSEPVPFPPP